jgi:hypothetical protein
MSDFQEFPKLLYLGGDINAAYVVVNDEAEEGAAEGYEVASLDPESAATPDAPKKRGRPAKAQ